MIRQAMQLNPRHPEWRRGRLAIALFATRRRQEAFDANWKLGLDTRLPGNWLEQLHASPN
jgi:hypothetical protein